MQKGLESAILRTFFADSYKIKNNMRCMLDKLNCAQYNIAKHKQRNLFLKEVYVMNSIPQKKKKLSLILKIIVIVSAFVGTAISAYGDGTSFMNGVQTFMYFTTQSNIAIAIICAVGYYKMSQGKDIGNVHYVIKYVGTVAITLTGVVFCFVLAPTLGANAWNVHNVLTHVVVPIASIVDFFVVAPGAGIKKKNVFYVIIPPLVYAIYAGIAYANGWEFSEGYNYPYFFLNWGSPAGAFGFTDELPFMGSAWWILALFIFLLIVGYCYLTIAEKIDKNNRSSK